MFTFSVVLSEQRGHFEPSPGGFEAAWRQPSPTKTDSQRQPPPSPSGPRVTTPADASYGKPHSTTTAGIGPHPWTGTRCAPPTQTPPSPPPPLPQPPPPHPSQPASSLPSLMPGDIAAPCVRPCTHALHPEQRSDLKDGDLLLRGESGQGALCSSGR